MSEVSNEPGDIRCHDCGTHDKCLAQQHAEDKLAAAEIEIQRLRNLIGNECE